MEQTVENYVYSEKIAPEKKLIKTDVQLYIVLLVSVFLIIALGNYLNNQFGIPQAPVQISLYVIFAVLSVYLYRYRLTDFSYLLTERMFVVDKVIGKKNRPAVALHLSDITKIVPTSELASIVKPCSKVYHGKKEDTLCIIFKLSGKEESVLISPTEEMKTKLIEQWKKVKK